MTSEQLKAARAEKWRQTGNAILTQEEAQAWIKEMGLVLYLPRRTQLQVEAPSFVEAVLGQPNQTPGREALEQAKELLIRLTAEGAVIPLNLLGTPGEQPDFLVSAEILPYIFALRGDRDWKRAPQASGVRSVSPLIAHIYQALDDAGSATLFDLRDKLGKELTEAAVLRGLTELWTELRVIPVFHGDGEPTLWQTLKLHHSKAMAQGTSTSQLTAVSVLSSLWLQTAVAASSEEVEIFLSPLTSRSKIREVLHGLSATRQLESTSLGHATYHFVAGSLPEFPEVAEPEEEEATEEAAPRFETGRTPGRFSRRPSAERSEPRDRREERPPRRDFDRQAATGRGGPRKFGPGAGREEGRGQRSFAAGGFRTPQRKPAWKSEEEPRERKPRTEGRREEGSFRKPRTERPAPGRGFQKRSEGRGPRDFERGGERPPRRQQSWQAEGEARERRPRTEGRREEGSFRKPRTERSAPGRGFQKRSEGRGPRDFERGGERPPRRQQSWQAEGETRERRPRTEGRREEGSFRKPRTDRSAPGGGFQKRSEGRGPRDFERGGERPPRRQQSWQAEGESRERRPRTEGRREEGSFRKPRTDRSAPGGGFQKRSEGRGSRDFERGGERPPRREFRSRSAGENTPRRESTDRREGGFGKRSSAGPRSDREGKRPGGFGAKGGRPKSGGGFSRKPAGGKFSSKPGNRPAKKFGRKERPE